MDAALGILSFASFVSHHHGQKMLKVWKGVSDGFCGTSNIQGGGRHCTPANPIYPGPATFGGKRGRRLRNSPFSRFPGWKPRSSNSEMLAGFLLLKLPVATMVNGSVSLAGRNGLSGALEKGGKKDRFAKASKTCKQGVLKCPESSEWTSRSIPFPKGRNRPLQLRFTKLWERRRLQSQPETNSKLAKLGAGLPRGAHHCARSTGVPQAPLLPPRLTCWEFAGADALAGQKAAGKPRQAPSSGGPSLGGLGTCGPKRQSAPRSPPAHPAPAPLSCLASGAAGVL